MEKYWRYIYTTILAICLILFTIGFKLGFVQQSLTWKIILGICAGFGVSAVINLKKSFN
jgi:hypothetical protein